MDQTFCPDCDCENESPVPDECTCDGKCYFHQGPDHPDLIREADQEDHWRDHGPVR